MQTLVDKSGLYNIIQTLYGKSYISKNVMPQLLILLN